MTTESGDPGGSHTCDGDPAPARWRRLIRWISVSVSCAGLSGGLISLFTLMADTTKGAVFVVLAVLPLLGVLLFLSAVLFAERPEPAKRLVKLIAAVRSRTSDR